MKTVMPLVSIGMPVHNGERFIQRALDSHVSQSYENIEILISDNASTDKTFDIIKAYAIKDPRIHIYSKKEKIGILENFRSVMECARGEYFMWAADDDQWLPDFVKAMVGELQNHHEAGIAMSAVNLINEEGQAIKTVRFEGRHNPNIKSYFQMMRGVTSFKKYNFYIYGLFRTSILRKVISLFPDVPGLDRLFICQLSLGVRLRYVDHVLHLRTVHHRASHIRLPNERFNVMKRDRWADFKVLSTLFRILSQSPIIPWYRKLYIPYVLWRQARLLLMVRFVYGVKRYLSSTAWNRLREKISISVFGVESTKEP